MPLPTLDYTCIQTDDERIVFELAVDGLTNEQIAAGAELPVTTIEGILRGIRARGTHIPRTSSGIPKALRAHAIGNLLSRNLYHGKDARKVARDLSRSERWVHAMVKVYRDQVRLVADEMRQDNLRHAAVAS